MGAGKMASVVRAPALPEVTIKGIVDINARNIQSIDGIPVILPKEIGDFDVMIVTAKHTEGSVYMESSLPGIRCRRYTAMRKVGLMFFLKRKECIFPKRRCLPTNKGWSMFRIFWESRELVRHTFICVKLMRSKKAMSSWMPVFAREILLCDLSIERGRFI